MSSNTTVGIVGAGIFGLACAARLLDAGYKVKIIARDLPGDAGFDWASPWAGAAFHPQLTKDPIEQEMQIKCFAYYCDLAKKEPHVGINIHTMLEYFDDRTDGSDVWYTSLPDFKVLPRGQYPPGCTYGVSYTAFTVNPPLFLPWMRGELSRRGASIERGHVSSLRDAAQKLGTCILVNASGNGAGALSGDEDVEAVRGQTFFFPCSYDKILMRTGSEYTYVIPRKDSGGVIMGGVKHHGRMDRVPEEEVRKDIIRRVKAISGDAFKDLDISAGINSIPGAKDIVGFRPGRKGGLRVEREGNIVHAYGGGGAGYIYSFGVGARVVELVGEITRKKTLAKL